MGNEIHQEIEFNAAPQRLYEALTDAAQFSRFTGGAVAQIQNSAGGAFSGFNGMITGMMVELVPGQRVVQAWRAGNWAPGEYSIARFELQPTKQGTRLVFDQAGHPAAAREQLDAGWHKMYWEPLKAFLGKI